MWWLLSIMFPLHPKRVPHKAQTVGLNIMHTVCHSLSDEKNKIVLICLYNFTCLIQFLGLQNLQTCTEIRRVLKKDTRHKVILIYLRYYCYESQIK